MRKRPRRKSSDVNMFQMRNYWKRVFMLGTYTIYAVILGKDAAKLGDSMHFLRLLQFIITSAVYSLRMLLILRRGKSDTIYGSHISGPKNFVAK